MTAHIDKVVGRRFGTISRRRAVGTLGLVWGLAPLLARSDSVPGTANYNVAFSAIRIRNTRSRHQDTLWIKINVSVDGVDRGTATWDGTGSRDKNNGYYDTLRNAGKQLIGVPTGPITDSSMVRVSFLVMNSGHTPNEDNYSKALASVSAAADTGSVWGYVVGALTSTLSFLVGANCDGPVAADSFQISGRQLREKLAGHSSYQWSDKTGYVMTNTPHGCGSNPNYSCIVQFTRHTG
jgi:hypothetical protein